MRINICEDDGTLLAIYTIDIAKLAEEVRALRLRPGDVRAAWVTLETVADAAGGLKDEVMAALARHARRDRR